MKSMRSFLRIVVKLARTTHHFGNSARCVCVKRAGERS
uniref:Uncharacterized protein n=1 Tax=Anguilla anguilla TaxID=7936 RepID=A0A0E9P7P0_ANGAN